VSEYVGIEPRAGIHRPSFGHENQHFRENQRKTFVFIKALLRDIGISLFWKREDLGGLFSVKILWQGSFHFLLQNEGIGLVRSKTS
jgi:hypothetical protein